MAPLVGRFGRWAAGRGAAALAVLSTLAAPAIRREPLPCRPLVVVAAALAGGVAVGLLVACPVPLLWAAAVAVLGLWGWLAARRHPAAAPTLLLAVAICGATWASAGWRLFSIDDLAWSLGHRPQPVGVEGTILEAPRPIPRSPDPLRGGSMPTSSECRIEIRSVRDGDSWRRASGLAVLVIDGDPPPLAGGTGVRVWARGLRPSPPGNPGESDRRTRARADRCLSVLRVAGTGSIEVLAVPGRGMLRTAIERIRDGAAAALARHVGGARGGLASVLLLGTREGIAPAGTEPYVLTGTVHVLSISGLHVALLAGGLFALARLTRLPHGWALAATAATTGLYMVLVGAETPVVRATLVVWLACLGGAVGRRSSAINALALAAILVLAWHPTELLRIGCQLSFLSTAVLVGAAGAAAAARDHHDPIARLIDRARPRWQRWLVRHGRDVADAVLVGAAVWLAAAPLVASHFHVASPVGLVLNPLIAPLVGMAMVGGFLCLLLDPVCTPLAALGGWACDGALWSMEWAVRGAAALPGAFVWVSGPPAWWVAGWYAGMSLMLLTLARSLLVRPVTWGIAAAAWAAFGLVVTLPSAGGGEAFEALVASMGHGCGIVIRGPSGRCLVYDAGRLGAPTAAGRGVSSLLWSEGIGRIDTLVISHADTDHFNGVPDLLERFDVGSVVVPKAFLASPSPAVAEVLRCIGRAGVRVEVVGAGDEIPFDPLCRVRVLHPAATATAEESPTDNESSLVVAVESAGRRLLLTGDLEGRALEEFIAGDPGHVDVLVAPHHGSPSSLPADLARVTAPSWVVVSGLEGPRWEEVRRTYETAAGEDSPARVLRSDGAIRFRIDAAGMEVRRFRDGAWREIGGEAAGDHVAGRRAPGLGPTMAGGLTPANGSNRDSSSRRPAAGG